ncbi:MAG: AsnC family transcriptional regulator [Legionellaceae bacterium]|nr:AsnC family transcriptional regulator [Legionellaceae bacterium]
MDRIDKKILDILQVNGRMSNQELSSKLASLSTTHFCDASPNIRILEGSIYRLAGPSSWVGRAFTVLSEGDILPGIRAIELASAGDVLIISSNTQHAVMGEILSTVAKNKGIVAIVIDGYCRDIDAIRNLSLPFYAKGTHPVAGPKNKLGQLNQSVVCGNISIEPQDIIFADDSGLIVMSEVEFCDLLPIATKIKNKEIIALEKLKKNMQLSELCNLHEHTENIKNNIPSVFKWL